jgi:large conductance mechanosensitive channel
MQIELQPGGRRMFGEFREFISKGSVIDLAVGVIIGAAFTAIVNSLVGDIVMPVIGYATQGINFSNLFFVIGGGDFPSLKAAKDAGAPVIGYGLFINAVVNFLVVSFVIFMIVRTINRLRRKQEAAAAAAPPATKTEILLEDIRDILKKK